MEPAGKTHSFHGYFPVGSEADTFGIVVFLDPSPFADQFRIGRGHVAAQRIHLDHVVGELGVLRDKVGDRFLFVVAFEPVDPGDVGVPQGDIANVDGLPIAGHRDRLVGRDLIDMLAGQGVDSLGQQHIKHGLLLGILFDLDCAGCVCLIIPKSQDDASLHQATQQSAMPSQLPTAVFTLLLAKGIGAVQ